MMWKLTLVGSLVGIAVVGSAVVGLGVGAFVGAGVPSSQLWLTLFHSHKGASQSFFFVMEEHEERLRCPLRTGASLRPPRMEAASAVPRTDAARARLSASAETIVMVAVVLRFMSTRGGTLPFNFEPHFLVV